MMQPSHLHLFFSEVHETSSCLGALHILTLGPVYNFPYSRIGSSGSTHLRYLVQSFPWQHQQDLGLFSNAAKCSQPSPLQSIQWEKHMSIPTNAMANPNSLEHPTVLNYLCCINSCFQKFIILNPDCFLNDSHFLRRICICIFCFQFTWYWLATGLFLSIVLEHSYAG